MTENFKMHEFLCPCKDSQCTGKKDFKNIRLVLKLEILRELVGNKPITITSGVRCAAHNKAVGGVENSHHLKGNAVDFVIKGLKPYEYYYLVEKIFGAGGIGFYNGFVHVDSGRKNRFRG